VNVRTVGKIEANRVSAARPATVRLLADAFGLHGQDRDRFCAAAGSIMDDPASDRTEPAQPPAEVTGFTGRATHLERTDALVGDVEVPPPARTSDISVIRVLGPVEVGSRHMTPLERLVLAVLTAHQGHIVSMDRLIDALWPDDPPASARNRVQGIVSSLRRTLPPGLIVTRSTGYALKGDHSHVDALAFEHLVRQAHAHSVDSDHAQAIKELQRALELWRGEPYEDVTTSAVAVEARRLNELRHRAVEDLFELRVESGEEVVITELAELVALYPLRQRLRGLLMTALDRDGRQAEALEVYRDGATLLAAEHGLEPSEDLRLLYDSILRNRPPKAVRANVPRQAPASLADFTGRQKELRLIHALLLEEPAHLGASVVVSISGMAGVGKTALAVRAAHDLSQRFPDGCLYADLRGADATPTPPLNVLGSFLRAYGISETLPSTMDERVALYRTVLSERRILVVLDNAAHEDQVRPLLPGTGAGVLVTSRRSLVGLPGAHLVHLEVFPAPDAIELLAAVAGRDRVETEIDAAQRVVQLCGGLPLAIRVAAVRLAQHDNLRMGALSARLADERERLDELAIADVDVRASLAISYQQLTRQHCQLLDALCVLPLESIPSWLVTRLLDVSSGGAHRLLEELSAAQLMISMASDRYQIHDLIRVFGRERAASDATGEIQKLTHRACQAMLEQMRRINAALPCRPIPLPGGDATWPGDPVEFFTAELGNIMAAVRFALSEDDPELAADLAVSVINICLMRGYVDEWEYGHQLVLVHGHRLSPKVLGTIELGLGTLRRFQDRNREALPHLRRAYHLLRNCGDRTGAAASLLSWGIAARMLGRVGIGRHANTATFTLLREAAGAKIVIGYALLAQHQLDRDLESLHQALSVFEAQAEHWGMAEAHSLLAARLRERGDLDGAVPHVYKAIEAYARVGDRVNLTTSELTLARIHMARSDHVTANQLLKRALRTAEELRHPWSQATAHRLLGQILLEQADPARAQPHFQRSVALMREAHQPAPLATSLDLLARAHAALGETDQALRAGQEAVDLLAELGSDAAGTLADWVSAIRPH
jgi:DNA-binding SARP family transcriptional activator